jgi:hypothetical protein
VGVGVGVSVGVGVGVNVGVGVGVSVGVGVGVNVGVGVGVSVGVGVGVSVGVGAAHTPFVIIFESSVTAPSLASSCPCTVAPVVAVMEVIARICPIN